MGRTTKTKQRKRKKAPIKRKKAKAKTPNTSQSDTSPFKGFNVSHSSEANGLFDKLVNDTEHGAQYRNIRTYVNKNKRRCVPNTGLLELQDCGHRDDILRWLENTQNVFDRMTQTQEVTAPDSNDETLDLPSVSQENTPNRGVDEKRVTRSRYKLRAKSLDIQVTKNVKRGRNKRHSVAGDTPDCREYEIEEVMSPVPADKGAIIIDLMEDEYLDNLDRELLNNEEQKTGWERIKDVNRTINKGKKQPKKLKIEVSPEKKSVTLINNNRTSYDYDILENFLIENMEKVMPQDSESSAEMGKRDTLYSVQNAVQLGESFLTILKQNQENGISLDEFQDLFNRLRPFIKSNPNTSTKNIQSEPCMTTTEVQTEKNAKHAYVQTENDTIHTGVQTSQVKIPQMSHSVEIQTVQVVNPQKGVQTDDVKYPQIQTVPNPASTKAIMPRTSTTTTPSDLIFADEKDKAEICDAFDSDFDYDTPTQKAENDVFDDDPVFALNTEEFFKEKTQESLLVVSNGGKSDTKGVKRPKPESPEVYKSKRPCDKFIREDLSIAVMSCPQDEEAEEKATQSSEDNDLNYDEYLKKMYQKYKITSKTPECLPLKTRTQEQIEEYENIIYEATKSSRLVPKPPREQTPSKSLNDSDYFAVVVDETTPKRSRRSLFDSKGKNSSPCSESIFVNDAHLTVVANRTLTKDEIDVDKEVREILENPKIKILDNVLVQSAKDDDTLSDLEVVESTPQKNHSRQELNVTLPPPLEFQDCQKEDPETSPPARRPLAVLNKVTSTPISQKFDSEKLTLSPITYHGRKPNAIVTPVAQENKRQQSKYTPLSVVKGPPSQTPKQKSILNYVRPSQEAQEKKQSESFRQKPCIACTRVSREQLMTITSMTNRKLATYSTSFTPRVTHLIVSVNERNCLKDHTIKYVSAVAAGRWVLNFGWVKECLRRNVLVPEEPYEVLDVSGIPGPQQARLTRTTDPLFKGYRIHAAVPFASTTQKEVENVVRLLGGEVVPKPECLYDKNGCICIVVTEAKATQDYELYETWLEALKVVTVDIEWLSRSVGQYQVLSLRPFTLCSDDNIEELGYPPELTVNMTFSFSQQTYSSVPSKP